MRLDGEDDFMFCVFRRNLKIDQKTGLLTALRSLVHHQIKNVESRWWRLVPKPAPERRSVEGGEAAPPAEPVARWAAPLNTSLFIPKGSRETGRTHPRRDDRDRQVAAVQEEGQHQEVDVAPVAGQQDHWVLLDGSLQLEGKGPTQRSRFPHS